MQLTNPELIRSVTSDWKGERDVNGRPLVPDDILERMKLVHSAVDRQGEAEGRIGFHNSWVIDELVEGDVIVVDLFGKVRDGTFAGDNLSTAIATRGKRGMVIDGGIRDTQRIRDIPDFDVFVRGFDPTAIRDVTQVEINGMIRIGEATCFPGDVVLGSVSGVIFIPPHLAQEVVETSEDIRLRDQFGQQRIAEGVYTPGEVDRAYSSDGARNGSKRPVTRGRLDRKEGRYP